MWDRELAINALVDDDINTFTSNDFDDYFKELLVFGCKGYANMTDEELMRELTDRDISTVFGECDDE
jgi:hypothetical protein